MIIWRELSKGSSGQDLPLMKVLRTLFDEGLQTANLKGGQAKVRKSWILSVLSCSDATHQN